MTNTVRPAIRESMPFSMSFSVRVSMEEVASSRISTGGSDTAASGNGQQLALALAETAAVPGDDGLVPLGQVADEGVGIGQPGRRPDLLIGGVQLPVADVVGHGSGEQVGILQNNAQRAAQGVLPDIPHVDAVIGDGAGLNVVKPVDEIGDGGLSRAGGAHKGDLLPRLCEQGHIVEHGFLRVIAEVHVLKPHVAPQLRQESRRTFFRPVAGAAVRLRQGVAVLQHPDQGGGAVVGFGVGVHHGENPLGAGHRRQKGIHLLADLATGWDTCLTYSRYAPREPMSNTPEMDSRPPTQQVTA